MIHFVFQEVLLDFRLLKASCYYYTIVKLLHSMSPAKSLTINLKQAKGEPPRKKGTKRNDTAEDETAHLHMSH